MNYTQSEIETIHRAIEQCMNLSQIEKMLNFNRSRNAIQKKIISIKIKMLSHEEQNPLQLKSTITPEWQKAVNETGARISEFGGQRVYTIDGKPVTIFEIMERHKAIKAMQPQQHA